MINLTSTSDILRLVTSTAVALDVHADWVDHTSAAYTPGRTNTVITTATTTTVVASPAASTQRSIKHLIICARGGANTVTVQHFDGATSVQMHSFPMTAGEVLEYTDTDGWRTLDASGNIQTTMVGSGGLLKATLVTATASPFVLDPRTRSVLVEMWGGSGAGGGAPINAANNASAGTGGNCGGYVRFLGAQSGSFVYAIGAAGTVGAAGAVGGNGGNTTATVAGVALTATGGTGGQVLATGTGNGETAPAAAVSGTGAGAELLSGPRGENALRIQTGAASTTVAAQGGRGAENPNGLGTGGPSRFITGGGNAATGLASGGGGACSLSGAAAQVGGAATGGAMRVWEYQ